MTEPFLKWPGGKRWLVPVVAQLLKPHLNGRYFEPFLGSAAVYFALQPKVATLSDLNEDLINTYAQVRDSREKIVSKLRRLRVSESEYYAIRAWEPVCPLDRAVRFLYLNRTAFNGLYRLNRDGKFNVPFGGGRRTPELLWETDLLAAASAALTHVKLLTCDFETVIDRASVGDVVYCDPTYTVAHDNNGFVRYNEKNFSWADQIRLARAAKRAARRGAIVLLSNAYHESVRDLYRHAQAMRVSRVSRVSAAAHARREVHEYLFLLARSTRVRFRT